MATFIILAVSQETFKKKGLTEEYAEGNQLIFLKGQNMKNKRKQSDPVKFLSMENCSDNYQFFFGDYIGFHDPMNRVANNMLGRDGLGYLVGFLV